jgi:cell division protein FtsW (lipid II flippase)
MNKSLRILALIAPILMFVVSILMIFALGFNVTSTMDAPPIPLYLNPSGYAFIIWQFIYIGFIALGTYQYSSRFKDDERFIQSRKYIILNSLLNSIWFLGTLTNQLWLTVVCIVGLLFTLIKLSIIFDLGKQGRDSKEKYFLKLPLSLYFGWITLATPINISSWLLTDLRWTGELTFGAQGWSVLILVVAFTIITVLYFTKKANGAYLLVGVWGLVAIFVANQRLENIVGYTALSLAVALVVVLIATRTIKNQQYALL